MHKVPTFQVQKVHRVFLGAQKVMESSQLQGHRQNGTKSGKHEK